jgi:L-threonylcarbamoyladenylate synthase
MGDFYQKMVPPLMAADLRPTKRDMTELLSAQSPEDLRRAAELLRSGGLVAIPTETVYGLAALGLDPSCVGAIYQAKGRPQHNPVILHVAEWSDAAVLWADETEAQQQALALAKRLATAFWPGPLTLILDRSALVPDRVSAGLPTVAVRCPAHPATRSILKALDQCLAAPSANASGRPSPTRAEHVLRSLDGRIDAVVDGGPCPGGLESTVLDLSGKVPVILRPGALPHQAIEAVVGKVEVRDAGLPAHSAPKSPGQLARHYAPDVPAIRLVGVQELEKLWKNKDVALLLRAGTERKLRERLGPRPQEAIAEILSDDPTAYGRELYAALYRLELANPALLAIEAVPDPSDPDGGPGDEGDPWGAIRDRLIRASSA